jgi:hypothetical protein
MSSEGENSFTGQILARLAKEYGFASDAALGERLGVTRQTISAWRNRDSLDYRLLLEKFPDADLNWLFLGRRPAERSGAEQITFELAMEYLTMLGYEVSVKKAHP